MMSMASRTLLRTACLGLAAAVIGGLPAGPALAAGEAAAPPARDWSFEGIFGRFDRPAVQRGLQVYTEVCASCHGLEHVHYRDLAQIGYDEDQIAAFAGQWEVEDGPDADGNMYMRPAEARDRFVSPFPNARAAAAANSGVAPPDLSLMYKARAGGADYIHALMTGYAEPPADFDLPAGVYYNPYFPGERIAMPELLFDGMVEYADGTAPTQDQLAADVTQFLAWAAEPKLEHRKATGLSVMLFMLVLTGLLYATKRKVWRDVH